VHALESFNRFHFHDYRALDKQINPVPAIELPSSIKHWQRPLALDREAPFEELKCEASLACRFQEAGPEFMMHGYRGCDYGFRDLVQVTIHNGTRMQPDDRPYEGRFPSHRRHDEGCG
jgi:hypothetical protein